MKIIIFEFSNNELIVIGLLYSLEYYLLFVDLADFNEELHRRALTNSVDCLPAFEDAFENVVRDQGTDNKVGFGVLILMRRVYGKVVDCRYGGSTLLEQK